jgi:hypothetical protein
MLAKVVKQQRAGRPITAGTVLTSEMTAAAGTMGTSWMWKVGNSTVEKTAIFSRDTSNSNRSSQLEH